jgi:hypothetical protein
LQRDVTELLVRDFGYVAAAGRPARKANGTPQDHAGDWQALIDNISAGTDLHASTRDLAAKMVRAGTDGGAVVNFLRGLMDRSAAPRDARWQARYDNLPRQVASIQEKIEREQEAAGPPLPGMGNGAPPPPPTSPNVGPTPGPGPAAQPLTTAHAAFRKWFGTEYDIDAATAVMAAAASEKLPGDPLWLLIVGGPGNAKTATVQALTGCGAHITSTIASEGALLSATPRKQRGAKATGGLLRKIGDHGVLVIKDFTSILSASRETRGMVLAAIREIYDGLWERNVGTDGGHTLTWIGRIVIVAAVTTHWDAAHTVVASMGDRFALLRMRSSKGRKEAGSGAIRNTGSELAQQQELAAVVNAAVAQMDTTPFQLSQDDVDQLVKAADLATLARSAVERDYRGEVEFAHDPEAPTRFAKQLVQLMRGAIAIGVEKDEAMRLVRRCAADSIPPLRRDILLDLASHPNSRVYDIRKRISQPRNTVRRGVECLHMLGTLVCVETDETDRNGTIRTVFRYRLADGFDKATLLDATNA